MSTMSWIRRPADYGARPMELPEPMSADVSVAFSTGPSSTTQGLFQYHEQNYARANPVLEQPQLDWTSLRQPITVQGHRRWVRTGMHASQPFQGRVFAAGRMWNQFLGRDRITAPGLRGYTYSMPTQPPNQDRGRIQDLATSGSAEGGPIGYVDRQGRMKPPPREADRRRRGR